MKRLFCKGQRIFAVMVLFFGYHVTAGAQASADAILRSAARVSVNYVTTLGDGFTFGDIAPGFMYANKRNHVHEVELNQASMDKSTSPMYDDTGMVIGFYTNRHNNFALRYQYTFNFLKKARLRPQAGISLLNQYVNTRTEPSISNIYPRTSRNWISLVSLSPQLRYDISPRYFVDVAVPVEILQFGAAYQRIENPTLPERQQRNGGLEFNSFPGLNDALHVRVGGGIRF